MLRRFALVFGLFAAFVALPASAEPARQDFGYDALTGTVCVFDKATPKQCVPIGTLNSVTHTFSHRVDVTQSNPTIPGWGVSFNLPSASGYSNGEARTYTVTSAATHPTNGMLLNMIVDPTYNRDIMSGTSATPVAVASNVELQVQKANGGSDYWSNLGVLDVQTAGTSGTGGVATAGIVRGNWTGTALTAGLRAQAENYSGRAAYGLIIGASKTDGTGSAFDNTFSYGAFVHDAHDYGFVVGGLEGANPATLPGTPFAFVNSNSTATLWSITNNSGTSATQYVKGSSVVDGELTVTSSNFPSEQSVNTSAPTDAKRWQTLTDATGTWMIRTLNDAQSAANNAISIRRSGAVPSAVAVVPTLELGQAAKFTAVTVAALPTCNAAADGQVRYVSDASAPSWGAAVTGGGSTKTLVLCNATSWTAR